MVIKFIITWRHYEIKILDSRVTAACIRTSVKAPNCSQEDNAHPSTRNSGMSEQDTHLRHSSHPHTEGGEVETLRNKAAVHILLVLSMLTLWYRAGSCSVPPSLHLLIIQQSTDPFTHAQNCTRRDLKPRNTSSISTLNVRKHLLHLVRDLTVEYFATTNSYYILWVLSKFTWEVGLTFS